MPRRHPPRTARTFYGTLIDTMASLFMSVTDGVSWESLCGALLHCSSCPVADVGQVDFSRKSYPHLSTCNYRVSRLSGRKVGGELIRLFLLALCVQQASLYRALLPTFREPRHTKCSREERKIYRPLHLISPLWSFLFLPPWLQMVYVASMKLPNMSSSKRPFPHEDLISNGTAGLHTEIVWC